MLALQTQGSEFDPQLTLKNKQLDNKWKPHKTRHTCNPSTGEAEAGRWIVGLVVPVEFQTSEGPCQKQKKTNKQKDVGALEMQIG